MKNIALCSIVMATLLLASCGSKPKNTATDAETDAAVPARSEAAVAMLGKMAAVSQQKLLLFGHQDDPSYGHSWNGCTGDPAMEGRSDTKDVCGDYPGIIGFDLGDIENGVDKNLDGVPFDKIRKEAVAQYLRGGLVTMSWHCDNPLTGGDAWDFSNKGTVESILEGGSQYEKFQEWLGRVADFLGSIETPDGTKVPVLFRPWHEHTGSWFWWGQDICTQEQYVALWRMTFEFMQASGVNNLLWAYGPGAEPVDQQTYLERYPGDDIVDVMGFDTYQGADRDQYMQTMKRCLDIVVEAAATHGKVPAVTETGYESTPDPTWWTGTLLPAIGDAPVAYVLVWRNAWDKPDHHYGIYPGHESEADFMTFYNDPRTLFAKNN